MIVSPIDEIPEQYAEALTAATSLGALREVVKLYGEVAIDAVAIVEAMNEDDFDDWRAALKKERRGTFMGESAAKRFLSILMPEVMSKIAIVAIECKVPWGLAYLKLKKSGRLKVKCGVATVDF